MQVASEPAQKRANRKVSAARVVEIAADAGDGTKDRVTVLEVHMQHLVTMMENIGNKVTEIYETVTEMRIESAARGEKTAQIEADVAELKSIIKATSDGNENQQGINSLFRKIMMYFGIAIAMLMISLAALEVERAFGIKLNIGG